MMKHDDMDHKIKLTMVFRNGLLGVFIIELAVKSIHFKKKPKQEERLEENSVQHISPLYYIQTTTQSCRRYAQCL